jgi:hypothetical protein
MMMRYNVVYFISVLLLIFSYFTGVAADGKTRMAISEFQGGIQQRVILTDLLIEFATSYTAKYQIVIANNSIKDVISRFQSEMEVGIIPKQDDFDPEKVGAELVLIPKADHFENIYVLTANILDLRTFEVIERQSIVRKGNSEILLELVKELWFKIEPLKDKSSSISAEFTIAPPIGKPSATNILSVSYHITCGNTSIQQSYVSNIKGKSYLMIGNKENGFLKTSCANQHGKDDISYHVELVQQQGRRIKTLVGKKIKPLEKNMGSAILRYEPEKWGFEQVEIDASEFIFRFLATEQREEELHALENRDIEDEEKLKTLLEQIINPDDYPRYIKGKFKHGKNKYSFKLNADSSEEPPIIWYTKADDEPIILMLEAYGYQSKPSTRKHEYYYNADIKGEELIVLDNDDFK